MNLSQCQLDRIPIEPPPRVKQRGIFAEKLANHIRETPARKLARQMSGIFTFFLISFVVISPRSAGLLAWWCFSAGGFIVAKIAIAWGVWRFRRKIAYFPRRVRNWRARRANRGKTIDGVPIAELVDYLVRNKAFKREGVNGALATFSLSMDRFNLLAKNLEKSGVLERGENNSRVLAGRWSRQSLVDFFEGKKKSSELLGGWVRIRSGEKVRRDNSEIL